MNLHYISKTVHIKSVVLDFNDLNNLSLNNDQLFATVEIDNFTSTFNKNYDSNHRQS